MKLSPLTRAFVPGPLIAAWAPVSSAEKPPNGLSEEIQELAKEASSQEEYAQAGAVILLREGRMTVGPDGLHTISFHLVIQVLDEKAARDYGVVADGEFDQPLGPLLNGAQAGSCDRNLHTAN